MLGFRMPKVQSRTMKTVLRNLLLFVALFGASMTFGAVPGMNVIVSDSSGALAFKGTTDANGAFATKSLKPGNYVVQFKSKSGAVNESSYALAISAGSKKVVANSVSGTMFNGGGVAMRVEVGAGLNITGQIISAPMGPDGNGKVMVWVPQMPGSNMPAHWAEKGSADEVFSRTRNIIHRYSIVKMQDHNDRGL
jgi:hypothetical protein